MNEDDIILMADASGLSFYGMGKDREKFMNYLEAFAALVAEREREACAKLCESHVSQPSRLHFATTIRMRGNT